MRGTLKKSKLAIEFEEMHDSLLLRKLQTLLKKKNFAGTDIKSELYLLMPYQLNNTHAVLIEIIA